jgi:dTDP-4-amino-4,6-dideoxygalactose transaminase
VERIEEIAKKHDLKVIYDAAHAFGVTYKGNSIFEYGDISTTSFHATKVFHTIEGGAVITKEANLVRIPCRS